VDNNWAQRSMTRRTALFLGAGAAGTLMLPGRAFASTCQAPLLLGATTNYSYPNSNGEHVEASSGLPFGMWRVFANSGSFDSAYLLNAIKVAKARGRKHILVSTRVKDWAGIAAGRYDQEICSLATTAAKAAQTAGITLWMTNWHEPETQVQNSASARNLWQAQQARFAAVVKASAPSVRVGAILIGWHEMSRASQWYPTWQMGAALPATLTRRLDWVAFDPYQSYGMPKSGGGYRTDWVNLPSYASFLAGWCRPRGLQWGFAEWGGSAAALAKQPTWMADTVKACASQGAAFCMYFDNTTYLPWRGNQVPPATDHTYAMPTGSRRQQEWVRLLKTSKSLPRPRT
jgi:hypothetical protein